MKEKKVNHEEDDFDSDWPETEDPTKESKDDEIENDLDDIDTTEPLDEY